MAGVWDWEQSGNFRLEANQLPRLPIYHPPSMPILPESVLTGPVIRSTTGTMHCPQPHGRDEPLMQSKVRGTIYPLYPLPQNKAHVPPPHAFEMGGGGAPESRLPQRKQFPQNFNTGSHLLDLQHRAPYAIDLASHKKRVLPPTQNGDLTPMTADFLHPLVIERNTPYHSICATFVPTLPSPSLVLLYPVYTPHTHTHTRTHARSPGMGTSTGRHPIASRTLA